MSHRKGSAPRPFAFHGLRGCSPGGVNYVILSPVQWLQWAWPHWGWYAAAYLEDLIRVRSGLMRDWRSGRFCYFLYLEQHQAARILIVW